MNFRFGLLAFAAISILLGIGIFGLFGANTFGDMANSLPLSKFAGLFGQGALITLGSGGVGQYFDRRAGVLPHPIYRVAMFLGILLSFMLIYAWIAG